MLDDGLHHLLRVCARRRRLEHADEELEPHALVRPLGHVQQVALGMHRDAVVVVDEHLLVAHPDDRAVARDEAIVVGAGDDLAAVPASDLLEHAGPIVGVDRADIEIRVGLPLRSRVAKEALDLRAHVDRRAALVERIDVDDERKLLDDRAEVGFVHPLTHRDGLAQP